MPTSTIIMMAVFGVVLVVYFVIMSRMKGQGGEWAADPVGGREAKRVRNDLKQGDLSSLKALLAVAGPGSWDDRDFFCEVLAPKVGDHLLDSWCKSEPQSALAFLVQGRALLERAHDARGHGTADTVTDEMRQRFLSLLQLAEQSLQKAAELDPTDPTPWAFLVATSRGLGQGIEEAQQRFQEAVRRDPTHYSAHRQMLTSLCEKWGGSHEMMFDFARGAANRAAEGHDLATLIINAHIERWLYFDFDEDPKGAKQYLKDAAVRQECLAAYMRSLASPQIQVRRSTIYARNTAAMWFFLARERNYLLGEVAQIGEAYSRVPWCYYDTPAKKAYAAATSYAYRT